MGTVGSNSTTHFAATEGGLIGRKTLIDSGLNNFRVDLTNTQTNSFFEVLHHLLIKQELNYIHVVADFVRYKQPI